MALTGAGLQVETETPLSVHFRGRVIGLFKADLVVEGKAIAELKTSERIVKAHEA